MENTKRKPTRLGTKLIAFAKERQLTRVELAKLWGYDRSSVHNIIFGHRMVSREQFVELMKIGKGYFTEKDFFV